MRPDHRNGWSQLFRASKRPYPLGRERSNLSLATGVYRYWTTISFKMLRQGAHHVDGIVRLPASSGTNSPKTTSSGSTKRPTQSGVHSMRSRSRSRSGGSGGRRDSRTGERNREAVRQLVMAIDRPSNVPFASQPVTVSRQNQAPHGARRPVTASLSRSSDDVQSLKSCFT